MLHVINDILDFSRLRNEKLNLTLEAVDLHPLVETVQTAFDLLTGRPPRIQGMTYGADMRLLVNEGQTPTVLFGPGDVRKAHKPDEYVPIADLITTVRTLALTALRFCGYNA